MPRLMIDMTGLRFGRLLVLDRAGNNGNGQLMWNCVCDCGSKVTVLGYRLRNGGTRSCGCLRREMTRETATGRRRTHGGSHDRLYRIWGHMRERCTDPNNRSYKNYGARGIGVCPEWDDYAVFRDWAQSSGYSDDLTIDRIDDSKGYGPDNCRWVTTGEQAGDRRDDRVLELDGERHDLAEWARLLEMNPRMLARRLRRGWPVEKALTLPVREKHLKKPVMENRSD